MWHVFFFKVIWQMVLLKMFHKLLVILLVYYKLFKLGILKLTILGYVLSQLNYCHLD